MVPRKREMITSFTFRHKGDGEVSLFKTVAAGLILQQKPNKHHSTTCLLYIDSYMSVLVVSGA